MSWKADQGRTPPTRVRLIARTDEARAALGAPEVRLDHFPCNVGRESRTARRRAMAVERRMGVVPPVNDVLLLQDDERRYVSREHFRISLVRGHFVLTDRGSTLGTTVNDRTIGGHRRGGHIDLADGDELRLGATSSLIIFDVRIE